MKGEFATEAALCADFILWAQSRYPELRCYAECGGWDILVVYPCGHQLGIQAKLRLSAEVVIQAIPDQWATFGESPDFRAILVPSITALATLAERFGIAVFHPWGNRPTDHHRYQGIFEWPKSLPANLTDWNPERRVQVPVAATDSVAGSPCPISLTPWKEKALRVIAVLTVSGEITTKKMRTMNIDPRRWISGGWLLPTETAGNFRRGEACPNLENQHPTAYAAILAAVQGDKSLTPEGV